MASNCGGSVSSGRGIKSPACYVCADRLKRHRVRGSHEDKPHTVAAVYRSGRGRVPAVESLEIAPVHDWAEVVQRLGNTLGGERDRAILQDELSRGVLSVWQIGAATVATRGEGSELVIVAMQGRGLDQVLPVITESATRQGFKTIRAHTDRPGLLRHARRIDPRCHHREYVIGIDLHG